MRAMKRNSDRTVVTAEGGIAERGLPNIRYRLAAAATLMAAVVVFIVLLLLSVAGVLNVTTFASGQESQGATVGVVLCGLLTLLMLFGTGYFALAVVKGVRDLMSSVFYTRGCIPEGDRGGRRNNWLV